MSSKSRAHLMMIEFHGRAVLLRQLMRSGPASLLHLLFAHWQDSPAVSWLGQLPLPARRRCCPAGACLLDHPDRGASDASSTTALSQGAVAPEAGSCLLAPAPVHAKKGGGGGGPSRNLVKKGQGATYAPTLPTVPCDGRECLTASNRIEVRGEDLDLSVLSRLYRPAPSVLAHRGHSQEGPRSGTACFLGSKPAFHPTSF